MSFYTYLMPSDPLTGLCIFVWSKMPMLPFFSLLADKRAPCHLLPPPFLPQPARPQERLSGTGSAHHSGDERRGRDLLIAVGIHGCQPARAWGTSGREGSAMN